MATAARLKHRINHPSRPQLFPAPAQIFRLHRAFSRAVRELGRRMERVEPGAWEGRSLTGGHIWSRNDLESTGLLIRYVHDFVAREGLAVSVSFESEELVLNPEPSEFAWGLRAIIDPVDGTKAFDNWACGGDLPLPRPSSAISIAIVCPALREIVLSVLYCFDLGDVFSSIYTGLDVEGKPQYCAFRDDALIPPIATEPSARAPITAKQRILNCDYNSRAMQEIARLNLALMDRDMRAGYGGLAGSSATDVVNVIRESFAAYVDVRALCRVGGSVLYFYDVAGVLPVALGRGLRVMLTDADGAPLKGADHPIYTPVSLVVARPDVYERAIEAIRTEVCPDFARGGLTHSMPAT